MKDWNMNKATTRRSHLMFVHELLHESSSAGHSPKDFNIDLQLSIEKRKYFEELYSVIHPDKVDNPFFRFKINENIPFPLEDSRDILMDEYKILFGKDIFRTKRRNIKQYLSDGTLKRKENGKLDYGKESYYVMNHKYILFHDELYDYSRKIKDRKYPELHPDPIPQEPIHHQEFAFLSDSDEEE